jgi:hypothetical protein
MPPEIDVSTLCGAGESDGAFDVFFSAIREWTMIQSKHRRWVRESSWIGNSPSVR